MAGVDPRHRAFEWFVAHPTFRVERWSDELVEACGFDVRDRYVEMFWLPIAGPSAVLALRRMADWLDLSPSGAQVDLVELGASLGIGTGTGRQTHINRTLGRIIDFGFARITPAGLEVRTVMPPVPRRMRRRLPLTLFDALTDHERQVLTSN